MSLGLKDLQKKRRVQKPNPPEGREQGGETFAAKPAPKSSFGRPSFGVRPKIPASVWSNKTVTARPWTDNGLSKGNRGRRSILDPEAAMNEEWINLFSTPWFWVECGPESRLIRLQQRFAQIEEQIGQKLRESLEAFRRFLG